MISEVFTLQDRIINALKGIFDPEIPVNIYDLGLIYHLDVDELSGQAKIQMTLTTPACPVAQTFPQMIQDEVLKVPGIQGVAVELVWDPPWTKDRMSEVAKFQLNMF